MPGRIYSSGYRYNYQGQEDAVNSNWQAFELRMHNSDLGRWFAPDPYGQFFSPYVSMGNNPVSGVDPDGGYYTGYGSSGNTNSANKSAMQKHEEVAKWYDDELASLYLLRHNGYLHGGYAWDQALAGLNAQRAAMDNAISNEGYDFEDKMIRNGMGGSNAFDGPDVIRRSGTSGLASDLVQDLFSDYQHITSSSGNLKYDWLAAHDGNVFGFYEWLNESGIATQDYLAQERNKDNSENINKPKGKGIKDGLDIGIGKGNFLQNFRYGFRRNILRKGDWANIHKFYVGLRINKSSRQVVRWRTINAGNDGMLGNNGVTPININVNVVGLVQLVYNEFNRPNQFTLTTSSGSFTNGPIAGRLGSNGNFILGPSVNSGGRVNIQIVPNGNSAIDRWSYQLQVQRTISFPSLKFDWYHSW